MDGRSILKQASQTPMGILFRDITGIRPLNHKLMQYTSAVSDAFLWRYSDTYRTRFDIMNLPSLTSPNDHFQDQVTVAFYSSKGKKIKRVQYELKEFETRPIEVEDILDGTSDFGIFSVFHIAQNQARDWSYQTCISERSYVSYRKKDDMTPIWSYVHGCCCSYVLAYDPTRQSIQTICRKSFYNQIYSPQVRFDDCDRFELIYTNPLSSATNLTVNLNDESNKLVEQVIRRLDPLETTVIDIENSKRDHVTISSDSHVFGWRPLIFKYYSSHFDVFHS